MYKDLEDEAEFVLSSKLQARYAGPYRITRKLSDILYEAQVHGTKRVIHAINMKPAHTALNIGISPADPVLADAELEEAVQEEAEQGADIAAQLQLAQPTAATQDALERLDLANQLLILRGVEDVFHDPAHTQVNREELSPSV